MVKRKNVLAGVGLIALLAASPTLAAGFLTNGLPPAGGTQYPGTLPLTGNETLPLDTQLPGGQAPQSESATVNQIINFDRGGAGSGGSRNMLIGGEAGTNLWQRGLTSASLTTTLAYTADRWFAWSGAATGLVVSQDLTAGEVPTNYPAGFKLQRPNGNTGVIQSCFAQEVETSTAIAAAGQTVEFSFHAFPGANFSPLNSAVSAYIISGTGSDEGATKLAWGLNGGGGGAGPAWAGQTTVVSGPVAVPAGSVGRFAAVGAVPAGVRELAVAVCYTPVGTAGAADYVVLSGLQLDRNSTVTPFVGQVAATTTIPAASFERRPQELETLLQQRYYFAINEVAAEYFMAGQVSATNVERMLFTFPNPMRIAPTCAFTSGGFQLNIGGTATAAGTLTQVQATPYFLTVGATLTGTAGTTAFLVGTGASGLIGCNSEL